MRKIIAICLIVLLAGCHRYDEVQLLHRFSLKPGDNIVLDRGYEVINGSVTIDYQNGIGTFKIRKVQDE